MQKINFFSLIIFPRIIFLSIFLLCASSTLNAQTANNPVIRSLTATAISESEMQLSWEAPNYVNPGNPIVAYNVYRDKAMITSPMALSLEKLVASVQPSELTFSDNVDYSSTYYYAVIVVTRNYAFNLITLGANSLINGASTMQQMLSKNLSNRSALGTNITDRSLGLPFLGTNSPEMANNIPENIDRFSVNSALSLTHIGSHLNLRSPNILRIDATPEALENNDDASQLSHILKDYFSVGKFPEAHRQLDELLRIAKSETVIARIHFYMGQCEYYLGTFNLSVQSFLQAKYIYPIEAYDWIDTVLKVVGR